MHVAGARRSSPPRSRSRQDGDTDGGWRAPRNVIDALEDAPVDGIVRLGEEDDQPLHRFAVLVLFA